MGRMVDVIYWNNRYKYDNHYNKLIGKMIFFFHNI